MPAKVFRSATVTHSSGTSRTAARHPTSTGRALEALAARAWIVKFPHEWNGVLVDVHSTSSLPGERRMSHGLAGLK